MTYETLLDATNRRILEELGRDARLSMAELGRRVSLSAPAVAERVQRLEREGVITGYRAEIDPKAIGYPIAVVVRVRPGSRQLQRIPEIARETPEVVECFRITGEGRRRPRSSTRLRCRAGAFPSSDGYSLVEVAQMLMSLSVA
jgi:DNA-binding Lrp family transcriptional regulator